jgi:hypothetical protein
MSNKKFTRTRGADRRGRFNHPRRLLAIEGVDERLIFQRDCGKLPDARTRAIRRALLRDFLNLEGHTNEEMLQRHMPLGAGQSQYEGEARAERVRQSLPVFVEGEVELFV